VACGTECGVACGAACGTACGCEADLECGVCGCECCAICGCDPDADRECGVACATDADGGVMITPERGSSWRPCTRRGGALDGSVGTRGAAGMMLRDRERLIETMLCGSAGS